jgi:rod shape-determining protein MreD
MSGRRALAGVALVVLAVVLQSAVVPHLPLPGGAPDLVLILVIAVGLLRGPAEGMLTGFAAGLLVDALAVQALGTAALVLVVAGCLAGLAARDAARSPGVALPVVGVLSGLAAAGLGIVLLLSGQPHAGPAALVERAVTTAAYDVAVAPLLLRALRARARPRALERVR